MSVWLPNVLERNEASFLISRFITQTFLLILNDLPANQFNSCGFTLKPREPLHGTLQSRGKAFLSHLVATPPASPQTMPESLAAKLLSEKLLGCRVALNWWAPVPSLPERQRVQWISTCWILSIPGVGWPWSSGWIWTEHCFIGSKLRMALQFKTILPF